MGQHCPRCLAASGGCWYITARQACYRPTNIDMGLWCCVILKPKSTMIQTHKSGLLQAGHKYDRQVPCEAVSMLTLLLKSTLAAQKLAPAAAGICAPPSVLSVWAFLMACSRAMAAGFSRLPDSPARAAAPSLEVTAAADKQHSCAVIGLCNDGDPACCEGRRMGVR